MMAVLGLVCYWVFEEKFASKGRNFVRHRSELRVLRTSLEREKKKPEFWLTGYVTNSGNYPWRVRELELRSWMPKAACWTSTTRRFRPVRRPAGRGRRLPRWAW